ncbi:MAG: hypothetical protein LBJ14_10345 [Desulfarculales bacterium]|jgi:hypothetical protein|nr:hypothetical protein [Desulfarculales bacterium]
MNISEAKDKLTGCLSGDAEYPISRIVEVIDETEESFYLQVMRKNTEVERFQCWRVDKKTGNCQQRPRWESEMFATTGPNARACESCLFRPTEYKGIKLDRASTDTCMIFEDPETKPHDVYFDGADCEFYEEEE